MGTGKTSVAETRIFITAQYQLLQRADMSVNIENLGFIGLGVMGEHMCRNLALKTTSPIFIYDVSQAAIARQDAQRTTPCASVSEVAANSDVVFLSLPSIDQVEQVCIGEGGLVSGTRKPKFIVDMSTSDVDRTRDLAKKLAELGVRFLDAPVARMVEAARTGTLLIMVGAADDADFATIAPLLGHMGTDVVHCGGPGCGQIVKIANNMVLMMNVATLAEALLVGERSGVDGKTLFNVLALGSATSAALHGAGIQSLAPRVFPEKRFSAAYALKDVTLASTLAKVSGVDAVMLERTRKLLHDAVESGESETYYGILINQIHTKS